jgi:hypothetical protein
MDSLITTGRNSGKMKATLDAWELRTYGIEIECRHVDERRPWDGWKLVVLKDGKFVKEGAVVYKTVNMPAVGELNDKLLALYRKDDWEAVRNGVLGRMFGE